MEGNPHISDPTRFKSVLFKDHHYHFHLSISFYLVVFPYTIENFIQAIFFAYSLPSFSIFSTSQWGITTPIFNSEMRNIRPKRISHNSMCCHYGE